MTNRVRYFLAALACLLLMLAPGRTAEAGLLDRIKDIYNAPEKVEDLQEHFAETREQLQQQQAELEDARETAERYLEQQRELQVQNERIRAQNEQYQAQNQQYQEQNAKLSAQNAMLLERLDRTERERKSLIRKIVWSIFTICSLAILYTISLRVWRYWVWRRNKRDGGISL